jgi:uncharacterized oligopeptide transporter (OPT) family protein
LSLYLARKKLGEEGSPSAKAAENTSVLLASGLIAGEALMGLVIAIFAVFNKFFSGLLGIEKPTYFLGLAIIAVLAYFLVRIPYKKALSTKN